MSELKIYKINLNEETTIPLYDGGLYCGDFKSGDFTAEVVNVAQWISDYGKCEYAAVIQGDSMKDLGYMPGDIGIVSREVEPTEGSVVVAYYNGDFTMKVFHKDEENQRVILYPANKNYEPIVLDNIEENFGVWGVVVRCIKNSTGGITIIKTAQREEKKKKQQLPSDQAMVKDCIEKLAESKIFTESKQWYAIYRVLMKYMDFPSDKKAFCRLIDTFELSGRVPACKYENWRKADYDFPNKLKADVDTWSAYRQDADQILLKQLDVAEKLKALLK